MEFRTDTLEAFEALVVTEVKHNTSNVAAIKQDANWPCRSSHLMTAQFRLSTVQLSSSPLRQPRWTPKPPCDTTRTPLSLYISVDAFSSVQGAQPMPFTLTKLEEKQFRVCRNNAIYVYAGNWTYC